MRSVSLLALILLSQVHALVPPKWTRDTPSNSFNWKNVTATEDLVFHDCSDILPDVQSPDKAPRKLQCARLSLYLDWQNTSDPRRTHIAIMRFPSGLNASDPKYGGPLIFNPGGPGISGTYLLQNTYARLEKQVNGGKKLFDIISFDPRGVGRSRPAALCFRQIAAEELLWKWRRLDSANLYISEEQRRLFWAAERERLALCAGQHQEASTSVNIFNFMGTKSVATDMLAIVDKLDSINKGLLSLAGNVMPTESSEAPHHVQQSGAKIQYLGSSYGTVLGNLFASMFPNRVKRMVLDGNVDATEWFGTGYRSIVNDADGAYNLFLETCFNHPDSCALANGNDTGAWDIKSRVDIAISSSKASFNQTTHPGADHTVAPSIHEGIQKALKRPFGGFRQISDNIRSLLDGVPWNNIYPNNDSQISNGQFDNTDLTILPNWVQTPYLSITCSDRNSRADENYEAFERYYASLESTSPTFGPSWANIEPSCRLWPENLQAKDRYHRPPGAGNSTLPILFLNTRHDPVCPLRNARRMSREYPGSVVLELNTAGHGALSQPSSCVKRYVQEYLADGTLPKPGTVCDDAGNPFDVIDPLL